MVLDREQGGLKNLEESGYKTRSIVTLTKAIDILQAAGKLDDESYNIVKEFISKVSIYNIW